MRVSDFIDRLESEIEFPVTADELRKQFGDIELEFERTTDRPAEETLAEYLERREAPRSPGVDRQADPEARVPESFETASQIREFMVDHH